MARLQARLLKELEGRTLALGGTTVVFERSADHLPAARQGGEGYAVPVRVGTERQILKIHHCPTPERRRRMLFLTRLLLSEAVAAFRAAPLAVVQATLPPGDGEVGPIAIEGHLAPRVEGQTLDTLLLDGWNPAPPLRLRLAVQLACAVGVLEQLGLAHADLSSGNVMIEEAEGSARLRLIDFDGFAHARVPAIPVSPQRGGRGFGSDGYRHAAYAAMDESTVVRCDRVALAALLFELMTVAGDDLAQLRRGTVLDQDDLDRGQVRVAAAVGARWPEGLALLVRAAGAATPESAPSPAQWLDLLAVRAGALAQPAGLRRAATVMATAAVPLRIRTPDGEELRLQLIRSEHGLGGVDARLAGLRLLRRGDRVQLLGEALELLELVSAAGATQHRGALALELRAGDHVHYDGFDITLG